MEVNQRDDDVQLFLPQEIYASSLKVISLISFTQRDIDIISCVMSRERVKEIASFLSISSKTVENHIHNVMLKLGCKSQKGIRDFVKKSGKFIPIRNYYLSLLIKSQFEIQLNKISILSANNRPSCLIVHEKEQEEKMFLIKQLERHLKLIGIKTFMEAREKYQSINGLIDKMASQQVNYVIYSLPIKFIEKPNPRSNMENLEAISPIQINNKYSDSFITLLLEKRIPVIDIPKELSSLNYIDLSEQGNYYFLVFKLLKKLLPNLNIDKNVSDFKLDCKTLNDLSFLQSDVEKPSLLTKESINDEFLKPLERKKIKILLYGGIFLISFFSFVVIYNESVGKKISKFQSMPLISLNSLPLQMKDKKLTNWNLPRQDHRFVGRKKLLDELNKKLHPQEHPKVNEPIIVSVCAGLGGVGKTQLVLQYVHQAKHLYTLNAWFASENLDQLKQQYIELAKTLGYTEENPSIKTALPYVKEWLLKNPGWLLVYDNVNNYSEIKEFLPENQGNIIITTRQKNWPSGFEIIDVDVMEEKESIELIQSLIRRKIGETEKEAAKDLVKILGYLPLALSQAGAYILQNQITIGEYLKLYKNDEQKLLADNSMPEGTNSLPVAVTWNMNIEAIAKEVEITNQLSPIFDLLNICAYLSPEKIPYNLLLTWLKNSYPHLESPELVLSKLIGKLWQYSLIRREENRDITMHRLVQAAIRQQHKKTSDKRKSNNPELTLEWYNILLKSAHDDFSNKVEFSENQIRKKNLFPHMQSLIENYRDFWPDYNSQPFGLVLNDIGFSLHYHFHDSHNALSYLKPALSILESFSNTESIEIISVLRNLGAVYQYIGTPEKAKDFLKRALTIAEKIYGDTSFETASVLDILGEDLGNIEQSTSFLERALSIKKSCCNKNQAEIIKTLVLLSAKYRVSSKNKEAKVLLEEAFTISKNCYNKDDPEIAKILTNLGIVCRNLGDNKQSEAFALRALDITEKYYGKGHIETAFALRSVGVTYLGLNSKILRDYHKAIEFSEQALKIYENYYKEPHVNIAITLINLGIAYRELKQLQQAQKFYERALGIFNHLGKKHLWWIGETLDNLGNVYCDLGNIAQAITLQEEALTLKEKHYGKNHVETAITLTNLANTYKISGDIEKTKNLLVRSLSIYENQYGSSHDKTKELKKMLQIK
jgi:tetratricopeptide (TPR) repeat protein/DNA-binding CsgD family transcriptional regulator